MNENPTNQITLTAEQLLNIVGHAATQEQLDNVRRELDTKIDRVDAKIERVAGELNAKIDRVDAKIERVAGELDAKIERVGNRTDNKVDTLKNWMIGAAFTMIVTVAGATAFIVARLPPQ